MKSLFAFMKKEGLESVRSGKIPVLIIVFALFGIMNPAIAKLTPWMAEIMADSLAETGMVITEVQVNALTSWAQFFKNIPMALIVFVLMYHGIFIKEYQTGTLILVLTKGMSRCLVVLAKSALMLMLWTFGYWLCFGITYGYNHYFWDNSIANHLFAAGVFWWLFGIWTVCLVVLFSTVSSNAAGVLLGTGCGVVGSYLIGFLPKIGEFMPTVLMNSSPLLIGEETADGYLKALVVTLSLCVGCLTIGIRLMNKKQI